MDLQRNQEYPWLSRIRMKKKTDIIGESAVDANVIFISSCIIETRRILVGSNQLREYKSDITFQGMVMRLGRNLSLLAVE